MTQRLHELKNTAPAVGVALRESLATGYGLGDFRADLMAGITVGIVAVPLAMALAIACGVPPQYGLYTSIVAGLVIALTGGSRVNISGPTAAFVVILVPIAHSYGLGGLVIATLMAGLILVAMGMMRLGGLVQFIPYPVTTGFTAGIAVVIATMQVKDFLGLEIDIVGGNFFEKLRTIFLNLPTLHWPDLLVGGATLAVMVAWPRLKTRIPGHMMALIAGAMLAWLLGLVSADLGVATIGSRFSYSVNGILEHGIPSLPPLFVWPWELPGADGQPVGLSFAMIHSLIGPAFAIAMLGAIESLLCAVVADGLAGTKHDSNAELVGQGLGNIVAPFFGGFAATAAIARTATNIRAGARTPIAAVIHALTVLLAVISLAGLLAYVPMASLAALLLVVAWNMSEAKHFYNIVNVAPRSDVAVLLTCFFLTVVFDMVLAVSVGVVLAALLFIRRMADLTGAQMVSQQAHPHLADLPRHVVVYDINGPLFFGAAEKALSTLHRVSREVKVVILDMTDVSMMDMTGIVAFDSLIKNMRKKKVSLIVSGLTPRLLEKLANAGIEPQPMGLTFCENLLQARAVALEPESTQQIGGDRL
ncbi:MAG: C4-dicarboxylic acid transporter DauA [Pseudomonadota bacterium]